MDAVERLEKSYSSAIESATEAIDGLEASTEAKNRQKAMRCALAASQCLGRARLAAAILDVDHGVKIPSEELDELEATVLDLLGRSVGN